MNDKEYLSKEKFKELKKELKELKTTKRTEIAERLGYARSLGDLSENAEYHSARDAQIEIETRIEELKELLKNVEIISHKKTDIAEAGSTVVLKKVGSSENITYQIVGQEEADLAVGKISYRSPLGAAILGKKKKEEFSLETPKGVSKYVVVDLL